MAEGIAALAERDLDVIVVARGGGAPGDMAWADSETVARAIIACSTPVWTAVGHATDRTVADLVANRSCETPSAAAAALIGLVDQEVQRRRTAAASAAHAAELARSTARARRARIACAVLVLVLAALLISGLGR